MADLQETLKRLAQGFVARDIMVPLERLTRADDEATVTHKLEQNPEYDIIPMPQKGRLTAFWERGATRAKIIQIQHVVSAETPIPDLLDSLCKQRHIFVVGRHEVIGLIHFSDFNDPIVKLPFFILLEGLERQVVDAIRSLVHDDTLSVFVQDTKRLAALKANMAKLQKKGANRDWVALLYFREVIDAAVSFGKLQLRAKEIEELSAVRNRVAHAATDQLVETQADVRRLDRVWRLCRDLLFA
jgi:hypothetical protein